MSRQEVGGSIPTAAVLCPWARHFTSRKYWLITQEAVAPSRHDWKIVDWDVKPQHKQHKWAVSWQNQQNGMWAQRRLGSAWASAQSDQSLLSAWRKIGSLATHWVHSKDWSDWADAQADLSLCWAHRSFCWFCHEVAQICFHCQQWCYVFILWVKL